MMEPKAYRILTVAEEELQRIVLNIHDGPVQKVYAALFKLDALQQRHPDLAPDLALIAQLISDSLAEIRDVLGGLRPPSFAKRTLAEIIRGVIMQHETISDCEVTFDYDQSDLPVSLPVKIALFRICQEALNNAWMHSGSHEQTVTLRREDNLVVLNVSDDGCGFVAPPLYGEQATEREEHIGLRGMRDRIALVDGCFMLTTAPQFGTTIEVRVACLT